MAGLKAPLFSILICHIPQRAALLAELMACLEPQLTPAVEVLVDDGAGEIGGKRQRMLQKSAGKYVAFIDDDDLVSENYVASILEAARDGPDVIGFKLRMTRQWDVCVTLEEFCIHSKRYDRWSESGVWPRRTYYRCPNHLNPVRRELAMATGFLDMGSGEDKDYSYRLHPLLKTEVFLDLPWLYWYRAGYAD